MSDADQVTWTDIDGGTHTVTGHPDLVAAFVRLQAALAGYTCPHCGATSYHPTDLAERYCGRCHRFE